jgi:hypothetical protein
VANTVVVDSANDVHIGGSFQGIVNFGGGNLQSSGGDDAFVATLNGADGSHHCSVKGGVGGGQTVAQLANRPGGGLRILGRLINSLNFGSTPATNLSEPSGTQFSLFLQAMTK